MEHTRPGTILIIDDDASMRDLLETLLANAEIDSIGASNAITAMELLRLHLDELSACLLDLNLGDCKGEEVFDLIKAVKPNLPIFAMSGITRDEIVDRFQNRAIAGIITKPFRVKQLIETIELGLLE